MSEAMLDLANPPPAANAPRVDPAQVAVPTLVIAVEGDRLVPMSDAVTLVEGLGTGGRLRVLRSQYGHDAFLKETDRIDGILATVFDPPVPRPGQAGPGAALDHASRIPNL